MAMQAIYYPNVNIGNEIFYVDIHGELTPAASEALRYVSREEADEEVERLEALGHHVELNFAFRMVQRAH